MEKFLNYWRATGHQRIGFLYGTYEIHTDVPLGIIIFCNVYAIKLKWKYFSVTLTFLFESQCNL